MSPTSPVTTASDSEATAGLTSQAARQRLAEVGPNEPTPVRRASGLQSILHLFANPLIAILLLASAVSAVVGEWVDAIIIVVTVSLSLGLNYIQTSRSQRAAQRLRETVAPTATVRRDGAWVEIPRREVVPGDVVRLVAGDLVPADGHLLEARDLHVQEAALTGESMPVEKEPGAPDAAQARVFLGTSVVSGIGTAQIDATGRATALGDIASRLAKRAPETEFERGLRGFSLLITRTVIFLILFVFLVNAAKQRDPLESLLFAVALAIGLIPEFLPMITTVTLAQGAVHMSRQKVIVKDLAAIQNFGSIDILCSDKTGTLTSGEMTLDRCVDPDGNPSDKPRQLAYLNSALETGIRSPLETAILAFQTDDIHAYRKLDEIPFDFERRRLSVVVATDQTRWLITKGAPESIIAVCDTVETGGAGGRA